MSDIGASSSAPATVDTQALDSFVGDRFSERQGIGSRAPVMCKSDMMQDWKWHCSQGRALAVARNGAGRARIPDSISTEESGAKARE